MQVELLWTGEGAHALAEGVFGARAEALQAHQDGIGSPGLIGLIGKSLGIDLVQQLDGVQIASMHTQDGGGTGSSGSFELPAIGAESKQALANREHSLLGGKDRCPVVKVHLLGSLDLSESMSAVVRDRCEHAVIFA
jgi:hypothetical protein